MREYFESKFQMILYTSARFEKVFIFSFIDNNI